MLNLKPEKISASALAVRFREIDMRKVFVMCLCVCSIGIGLLMPSELRAQDVTWITESGQEVHFRGLINRTYSGPGVYRTDIRLQVVLPEGTGEHDYVAIADSLFEEVLGPVVTMMGTRRALISFGTMGSGSGEDWSSNGPEMTYLRRGRIENMTDARWRRSSHGRVSPGESSLANVDASVTRTLPNGAVIVTRSPTRSYNPLLDEEFLNVRYEAPLSEQDGRSPVDNSLLYWRTIIEPAVADSDVQMVQIIAHEEERSDRFHFRCGSVVQLRRQKDGGWTETIGAPQLVQFGNLSFLFVSDNSSNESENVPNGCSF